MDFRGENLTQKYRDPRNTSCVSIEIHGFQNWVKESAVWILKEVKVQEISSSHHISLISWWIHSLELPPPPAPPSTQDAKPRQHQDYEPFFVGNPNLNLHLWRLHPGCGGETKSISWLYYFRTLFILENIIDLSRCLADSFAPPLFFLGRWRWKLALKKCKHLLLGTSWPTRADPILQVFGLNRKILKAPCHFQQRKTNGEIGGDEKCLESIFFSYNMFLQQLDSVTKTLWRTKTNLPTSSGPNNFFALRKPN